MKFAMQQLYHIRIMVPVPKPLVHVLVPVFSIALSQFLEMSQFVDIGKYHSFTIHFDASWGSFIQTTMFIEHAVFKTPVTSQCIIILGIRMVACYQLYRTRAV